MRTPVLAAAAATGLLALALPASAGDPTPPCAVQEGVTTLTPSAPSTLVFDAPLVPGAAADTLADVDPDTAGALASDASKAVFRFVVDTSGSSALPTARKGAATFTLSWGDDSDYDLAVLDSTGRELGSGGAFNPTDGSGETATTGTVATCSVLTVEVRNFAGAPGQMTLAGKLGNLRA